MNSSRTVCCLNAFASYRMNMMAIKLCLSGWESIRFFLEEPTWICPSWIKVQDLFWQGYRNFDIWKEWNGWWFKKGNKCWHRSAVVGEEGRAKCRLLAIVPVVERRSKEMIWFQTECSALRNNSSFHARYRTRYRLFNCINIFDCVERDSNETDGFRWGRL